MQPGSRLRHQRDGEPEEAAAVGVVRGGVFDLGATGAVVTLTVLDDRGRVVFTVRQAVNERLPGSHPVTAT